jgi:hypothetical protein
MGFVLLGLAVVARPIGGAGVGRELLLGQPDDLAMPAQTDDIVARFFPTFR